MSAPRTSPLAHAMATRHPQWANVHGMPMALRFEGERREWPDVLGVCDLSALVRAGVKGPGAAAWLEAQGVPVPQQPNTWLPCGAGGLVARLARTEFLVEDGFDGETAVRLKQALKAAAPGVYPVPRQDCALVLCGARVHELLAQTCNVNFEGQDAAGRIVTLTLLAGVSVTVLRNDAGDRPAYRLWCDGTMGPYLWETLTAIAGELGGGAVGAASLFPQLAP